MILAGTSSPSRSKASDFDHASRFFYAPFRHTHPGRSRNICLTDIPTPQYVDHITKLLTAIAIIEKIYTKLTPPLLAGSHHLHRLPQKYANHWSTCRRIRFFMYWTRAEPTLVRLYEPSLPHNYARNIGYEIKMFILDIRQHWPQLRHVQCKRATV